MFINTLNNQALQICAFNKNKYYCYLRNSIQPMLDFASQKKILDPILKNPKNHLCADCDSISPTWASLDFGVFLCSNCSGAHRGLGPTITRVRSANLDKWQQEWIDNMRIGNSQLNKFWQSDNRALQKKPKIGSTLNEIGRYVFEKYIKKKYVKNRYDADPLTCYKNGMYNSSKKQQNDVHQDPLSQVIPIGQQQQKPKIISQLPKTKNSFSGNLLEFDLPEQPLYQVGNTAKSNNIQLNGYYNGQMNGNGFQNNNMQYNHHQHNSDKPLSNSQVAQEDQFTAFAEAGSSTENTANDNFISFDALLGQQKKPQPPVAINHYNSYQDLKTQNINIHHPYNPLLSQHNLVYQAQYQNMHSQNIFQANPNIMSHSNHYNYPQPIQGGYIGMPYQNANPGLVASNAYWK